MGEGGGTTSGIVGREGERARLRAALAAAQWGEPRVVVVEGAAGILANPGTGDDFAVVKLAGAWLLL